MYGLLIIVQVVLSIALIVLVLLQHGKGADAGAAFGSGASSTVFGSRGSANFFSRATGIVATLFFINCLGLAYLVSHQHTTSDSIVDTYEAGQAVEQPIDAPADVPAAPSRPSDIPE